MKWIYSVLFLLFTLSTTGSAQWPKRLDPGVPRTRAGKLDPTAPPPKTLDGRLDLSGVWLSQPDPNGTPQGVENIVVPRYFINIMADFKPEDVPMQPWAMALLKERIESQGKLSPSSRCQPTGVPAAGTVPLPYKIIQTPHLIVILYEENTVFRQIFLDDRPLPKDPDPRWMGYSVGRWDGDAFVVDSIALDDRVWADMWGHPISSKAHIRERFRRPAFDTLELQMTITDPDLYTKPWVSDTKVHRLQVEKAMDERLETFCVPSEEENFNKSIRDPAGGVVR